MEKWQAKNSFIHNNRAAAGPDPNRCRLRFSWNQFLLSDLLIIAKSNRYTGIPVVSKGCRTGCTINLSGPNSSTTELPEMQPRGSSFAFAFGTFHHFSLGHLHPRSITAVAFAPSGRSLETTNGLGVGHDGFSMAYVLVTMSKALMPYHHF